MASQVQRQNGKKSSELHEPSCYGSITQACNRLTFQTHTLAFRQPLGWAGFLRGSTPHEVISICFVDINFKFIAVVKSDCWTKSIINWVNGLREFYVNFLNGCSQSVSNHPPSLPELPPTTHTLTHLASSISEAQHESRQLRWDLRACMCVCVYVCVCVWRGLCKLNHWAGTIYFSILLHIIKSCWSWITVYY